MFFIDGAISVEVLVIRPRGPGLVFCCSCCAPLRALVIVNEEILAENDLHLLDGLELGSALLDTEMLVQQVSVESYD